MTTRLITHIVFLLLLWLVAIGAQAEAAIALIDNLETAFDLSPFIETMEDPQRQYTLDSIKSGKYDHRWQRNTQRYFTGENFKSKYWFRMRFNWQSQPGRCDMQSSTHCNCSTMISIIS